jgi:hypothetical protein
VVLVSKQASVEGSRFTHCLDPRSIHCIVQNDVLGRHIFDDIYLARVLANAAHGKAQPCVERAVCDVDVGRVLLHADRVVSVVNDPAQKGNVVGIGGLRLTGEQVSYAMHLGNLAIHPPRQC